MLSDMVLPADTLSADRLFPPRNPRLASLYAM